jgi:hypothetical protein
MMYIVMSFILMILKTLSRIFYQVVLTIIIVMIRMALIIINSNLVHQLTIQIWLKLLMFMPDF